MTIASTGNGVWMKSACFGQPANFIRNAKTAEKSEIANASSPAAATPGAISGSVTRRSVCHWLAPRSVGVLAMLGAARVADQGRDVVGREALLEVAGELADRRRVVVEVDEHEAGERVDAHRGEPQPLAVQAAGEAADLGLVGAWVGNKEEPIRGIDEAFGQPRVAQMGFAYGSTQAGIDPEQSLGGKRPHPGLLSKPA